MSERETRKLETPKGKIEVVIYTYMNGGELMDLEGVAIGAGMKSVDGRSGEIHMTAESAYSKRLRKLADIMIVSIGEATSPAERWEALRALQGPDYNFVMKEVEDAAAGVDKDAGKA